MYEEFHESRDRCDYCGWQRDRYDVYWLGKPRGILEAAHLKGGVGFREPDVRGLVCLCNVCHLRFDRGRIMYCGELLPDITLAELLWCKREVEGPVAYRACRKYLKELWYGDDLPRAKRPRGGIHGMAENT